MTPFDNHINAIIDEHNRAVARSAQLTLLQKVLYKDHGLSATWDGLRHFWDIELTPDAVSARDEQCKSEASLVAENAKLRVRIMNLAILA